MKKQLQKVQKSKLLLHNMDFAGFCRRLLLKLTRFGGKGNKKTIFKLLKLLEI